MNGSKIGYYCGDPGKITDDCALLKPALFPSVPRLFNRIYSKIKERLDGLTGCSGWIAQRGLAAKIAAAATTGAFTNACYDKLVFRKVSALLGGNVRFMITGSAPIDPNVLNLLKVCFCCPFLEGYGLTETSGGSSVTWPNDPNTGHVGGPLPCIKWRLMDVEAMNYLSTDKPYPRGELMMKGPAVTSGYYKNPEKTKDAFDHDGWFKTGDVAIIYPNGSARIIDRSKNIFKLSQGEYIAPEKIENIFGLSNLISQAMLYGDSLRSCTIAVIVPHMHKVKEWAAAQGKLTRHTLIYCLM
jgi:long-chain acyl-CoA synthetase